MNHGFVTKIYFNLRDIQNCSCWIWWENTSQASTTFSFCALECNRLEPSRWPHLDRAQTVNGCSLRRSLEHSDVSTRSRASLMLNCCSHRCTCRWGTRGLRCIRSRLDFLTASNCATTCSTSSPWLEFKELSVFSLFTYTVSLIPFG